MISFDYILSKRIKQGNYQYLSIVLCSLVCFVNGLQITLFTILMRIYQFQWELHNYQLSLIPIAFFAGAFVGCLLGSFYGDFLGRAKFLLIVLFISLLGYFWNLFATSLWEIGIIQFIIGTSWFISMVLSAVIIIEITPYHLRGLCLAILNIFVVLGILFQITICWVVLKDFQNPQWKTILVINILLNSIVSFLILALLDESPRFYFCNSEFKKSFELINKMIKCNQSSEKMLTNFEVNYSQKDSLIKFQLINQKRNVSFRSLFQDGQSKKTILLWFITTFQALQVNGFIILLPFLLKQRENEFQGMFIIYVFEIPLVILSLCFLDSNKFCRRKELYFFCMLLTFLTHCIIFIFETNALIVGGILLKLVERLMWTLLSIITNESYETILRARAASSCSMVSKASSAFFPLLLFPLYEYSNFFPFLLFGIISGINCILIAVYPIDKTCQPLDVDL